MPATARICPQCKSEFQGNERICPKDGSILADPKPAKDAPDEHIGKTLSGKYRIDGFVNRGGMGAVYRGTHLMLGKPLAIKLIHPSLVSSEETLKRFQREARSASALNHPNIVTVHDLGQSEDGTLYIAMELVKGQSLKNLIVKGGPMTPARIVRLASQMCGALAMAHKAGIVHRDLKPQNVMVVTDADGSETAKLLDFGIAKTFEAEDGTALTSTGMILGTPQYMAPEQAAGRGVDPRSDIYSLGVILYEMVVGEVPFNDPSITSILYKHVWEPPKPPSTRRPDLKVPPALEAIVLKCLAKEPERRYQTIDELFSDLRAFDAGAIATQALGVAAGAGDETQTLGQTPVPSGPRPAAAMTGTATALAPPAAATAALAASAMGASAQPSVARGSITGPGSITSPTQARAAAVVAAPHAPSRAPLFAIAAAVVVLIGVGFLLFDQLKSSVVKLAGDRAMVDGASNEPPPDASPAMARLADPPGKASRPMVDHAPAVAPSSGASVESASAARPIDGAGSAAVATVQVDRPAGDGAATALAEEPASDDDAGLPPSEPTGGDEVETASEPPSLPVKIAQVDGSGARRLPSPAGAPGVRPVGAPPAPFVPPARVQPPPLPADPTVHVLCQGPPDVCPAVKNAVAKSLAQGGMKPVPDPRRADVVVVVLAEFVDERSDYQFGTTFVVRTYSFELEANVPRFHDSIDMPVIDTLSFDSRVGRERLNEKARVIGGEVASAVRGYWDGKVGGR